MMEPFFVSSQQPLPEFARRRGTASTPTNLENSRNSTAAQQPRLTSQASRTAVLDLAAKRAFGALLPVLEQPLLRDVMVQVSGGQGQLWVDTGDGLRRQSQWQVSAAEVRAMAVQLIAAGGRHIDELHPCENVRLGDGIRVHAVLPPVCTAGAVISIRVPREEPISFAELVQQGMCSEPVATLLRDAVAARQNILITGGTGTGKTTLLAALLDLAPAAERILTIEDVAELRLTHPHWVALETRQANTEGVGELGLDRLLREALRMRPDRIVLGECRGPEVLTLLAALNTGHDGGAGTLHASRLGDVPVRLETLGALGGLSPTALARQVCSALQWVVHIERDSTGKSTVRLGRFKLSDGVLAVEEVDAEPAAQTVVSDPALPPTALPVAATRMSRRIELRRAA